jgi:hypothetical protein
MTIPQEYLDFRTQQDFGFSAVDETEVTQTTDQETLETTVLRETVSTSSETVSRLESKMDGLLTLYDESKFGLEEARARLEDTFIQKEKVLNEAHAESLKTLEQMIVPLLVNLMKDTDREYLYWPNRKPVIEDQIEKILAVTRVS